MRRAVDKPQDHRRRVAGTLALIASRSLQQRLEPEKGAEHVAYELCTLWFDDVYIPSGRYIDGLKGDFSSADAAAFEGAFSEDELAALERFHRFLELRMEMVPQEDLRQERIPIDDRWRGIMKDAGYLLEDLGFDTHTVHRDIIGVIDNAGRIEG